MSRRPAPESFDDAFEIDPLEPLGPDGSDGPDGPASRTPDLAALPIAGITRRRIAVLASALLAVWIVIAFARQVSEASDAATRAQGIASGNAALRLDVAAMERELDAIARQRFIEQQARGFGVGGEREIPFALAPDAPTLPTDAPGSAAVRVGADLDDVPPFERWLTVLFGSTA